MNITFRPATQADLFFIARGFHMAMLMDADDTERIQRFSDAVCAEPGVLYSPENTIIACVDGTPAGMITAYDGARYHAMRERTFQLVKERLGVEFPGMEDEAVAGEYYLDSLAVLPEYRGNGIGRLLLLRAIDHASELGIPKVTLAVDPENPKAQRLYESLGFRRGRDLFIFGHTYWQMVL